MFFRGYVPTKGKRCLIPFANNKKIKTFEEVKDLTEFAGVLSDDTILLDIDSQVEAEKVLNIVKDYNIRCRVYQTTKGMHFLFKKCIDSNKTKCTLAIGINADIKNGNKNSYSVLKFDGKYRTILYDTSGMGEEAEEFPLFFKPINLTRSFTSMKTGDGRNQALYNHILILQNNNFAKDTIKQIIRIVNKYIFDEPLPNDEVDKILRDESFGKPPFFNKQTFLFNNFANYMKDKYHICRINNQVHIYKGGIYTMEKNTIESTMINELPTLNQAKRREVMSYLELIAGDNVVNEDVNFIAFKNGIYDIATRSFLAFNPSYKITNLIPWDYDDTAFSLDVDRVLDNISNNNRNIRNLLEELIGYCFFRRNELGKAFILTGNGGNGKSTYINMLKRLLGTANYSVLDLNKLGDRFSTVMLFGKLANLGDDICSGYIPDTSMFKKICTGETVDAEQKGYPKFSFNPYCKLVFSANSVPRLGRGADSDAIMRRLILIPFTAKFTKSNGNYQPFVADNLKTPSAMSYLINLGLEGLHRVLERQEFTKCVETQAEMDDFEEGINPLIQFLHTEMLPSEMYNQSTKTVYDKYRDFCFKNSYIPISHVNFNKEIKSKFNFDIKERQVKGVKLRVFVDKERKYERPEELQREWGKN